MEKKYFKTRLIAKARICDMSKRSKANAIDEAIIDIVPAEEQNVENEYIENQPDLMMVESILVSTGMNGNDDVFLPSELIEIRDTGKHKPVNIEHDDNKIVGHIVESFPTTKKGERIIEEDINDAEKMPSSFDLTNRAVVYACVFPSLAHEIREEASNNQLFVSVEVWYKDYDYLVGNSIVERNERTAMVFDPVLRINGGTGYINGMKTGKVLRNMLIAGVGLVANPANEESVIKSVSNSDKENSEAVSLDIVDKFRVGYFNSEETVMKKIKAGEEKTNASVVDKQSKEESTKTLEKVQNVKVDTKESLEKDEVVKTKAAETEDNAQIKSDTEDQDQEETVTETKTEKQEVEETEDVDQIDETIASKDSLDNKVLETTELEANISELKEALTTKSDELKEVTAKLQKLEQEKLNSERISEVVKVLNVEESKAKKLVDKSTAMNKDVFSGYLKDLLDLFEDKSTSDETKKKEEKVEEKTTEEPKEEPKEDVAQEDTEIEEAIDEALDNAKKEKEVVEFKENNEKDNLVVQFAEVINKFVK